MKPTKTIRYHLTISYDGTHYSGWQIQPNSKTIQEMIELSLGKILQEQVNIIGSGRTDSGVHALGQIAHFDTEKKIDPEKVKKSLNSLLPNDIRIKELKEVNSDFHARFSSKRKIYRYHLHRKKITDPFNTSYRLHFPYPLDLEKMKEAKDYLLGTHDFSSFANKAHEGSAKNDPVKTLYRIDFIETDYGLILEYEGSGFLYKMVRNLTGTLLEVGQQRIAPKRVLEILLSKDRKQAHCAVPAHGLFLTKVHYSED